MRKILISLGMIAFVGAVVVGATGAFFSDTETSTGNTFAAGAIDLTVDSEQHYNGMVCTDKEQQGVYTWQPENGTQEPYYPPQGSLCGGTWGQPEGLDIVGERFFDFVDVKPGDGGENTVSLHVENNDAWACVSIIPTKNDDVSSTEPELEAGDDPNTDSIFDGELAQNMTFKIWADVCGGEFAIADGNPNAVPGDNIYQEGCDRLLTSGNGPIVPTTYELATPVGNVFTGTQVPLNGTQTYYLGVEWGIANTVGNIIQTDNYQANISFYVEQSRNNPNFVCTSVAPQPNVLRLENEIPVEGGPWKVIVDDKYVDMTYNSSGATFDYTLTGQGLAPSTEYALIYYADGWPGNHPGALIGKHMTGADGKLNVPTVNKELNMDLPHPSDGNYAIGAKIWLIPSSAYNEGTNSVTVWPPNFDTWFFEGNVYINYDDTGVSYP